MEGKTDATTKTRPPVSFAIHMLLGTPGEVCRLRQRGLESGSQAGTQAPQLHSSTALVARCRCQQDTNHSGLHSDGGREAEVALLVLAGEGEAFLEHSHRLLEISEEGK